MEKVKKKMQDLRNDIEDREDKISQLCKELEEEKAEKQVLEDQNKSLGFKIQTLGEDLEKTESRLDDAERTKSTLESSYTDTTNYSKSQIDTLERDLDRASADLESYKSRCHEAEEGREVAEREVGVLSAKVDALESQLDREELKFRELKADHDRIMEELNSM